MLQLEHLLELRLIPFAAAQRITVIQEMDGAEIWGQFRRSWKNENPHRNRPVANPESAAAIPLGKGTVCRMIADLRMFLKHCVRPRVALRQLGSAGSRDVGRLAG